jgi:hypothetical protein
MALSSSAKKPHSVSNRGRLTAKMRPKRLAARGRGRKDKPRDEFATDSRADDICSRAFQVNPEGSRRHLVR